MVDKTDVRNDPHRHTPGRQEKTSGLSKAFFPEKAGIFGAIHISTALTKKTFNFYFYLMLKRLNKSSSGRENDYEDYL